MIRVKGVKIHVLRSEPPPRAHYAKFGSYFDFNRGESLVRVITDAGIEGHCITDSAIAEELLKRFAGDRTFELNEERVEGLIGTDPLDRERIEKMWLSRYSWAPLNNAVSCALDECLWDIAGKVVDLPVYKLIGAYREKIPAYASSLFYEDQKDYVEMALKCKKAGFRAFKIHPHLNWKKDIALCRAVREAVGERMQLMLDPVGVYTRDQAIKVGREIEKLGFYWFEDPIATTDLDGLSALCRTFDIRILMGEFIKDLRGYTEYIRRGAADALRCWDVNVGGLTPTLKIAHLAECYGMNFEIVSWGTTVTQAAALSAMLAIKNTDFFELVVPEGVFDRGFKQRVTMDRDGYVHAPEKPGLGVDLDWDMIEKSTIKTLTHP